MARVTPHIEALVAEHQHHCQPIKPAVLTTRQAAEYCGIAKGTLYNLIHLGRGRRTPSTASGTPSCPTNSTDGSTLDCPQCDLRSCTRPTQMVGLVIFGLLAPTFLRPQPRAASRVWSCSPGSRVVQGRVRRVPRSYFSGSGGSGRRIRLCVVTEHGSRSRYARIRPRVEMGGRHPPSS